MIFAKFGLELADFHLERNRRRVNPSLETNTSWFDDVSVTFLL